MNVGGRKLQANWLTLQIYRVVHNCEKLLNYANVLLAKKSWRQRKCKTRLFITP